ncbi:cytochrome c oxidase subunit 6C-1-like [Macrobrachium rosenbergii]|uniref:cytochrome c oxidase subunit 6C-1-like n=1 Tax=Macrobrachium rosenbergii TaxID=79674 RepID=UPI0034D4EEB7
MAQVKPVMRGLLGQQIKRNLIISGVLCIITVSGYKFGIQNPRKQRYADFYKDYDAEKEFERMKNLGLFQSARPDGEEE